jgi:hypothetical protein
MFMKTIAVGPFEDVLSWVTGGTIVAIDRCCESTPNLAASRVHFATHFEKLALVDWRTRLVIGFRRDIVMYGRPPSWKIESKYQEEKFGMSAVVRAK